MNSNNISEIVSKSLQESKRIRSFIKKTRQKLLKKKPSDDKIILESIIKELNNNNSNPLILNLFADFLQIIDDSLLLDTYELKDIERLHINNHRNQKQDLTYLEDLIFWYWNVMDDEKKTKKYINEAINICEKKIDEMHKLQLEIDNFKIKEMGES